MGSTQNHIQMKTCANKTVITSHEYFISITQNLLLVRFLCVSQLNTFPPRGGMFLESYFGVTSHFRSCNFFGLPAFFFHFVMVKINMMGVQNLTFFTKRYAKSIDLHLSFSKHQKNNSNSKNS